MPSNTVPDRYLQKEERKKKKLSQLLDKYLSVGCTNFEFDFAWRKHKRYPAILILSMSQTTNESNDGDMVDPWVDPDRLTELLNFGFEEVLNSFNIKMLSSFFK